LLNYLCESIYFSPGRLFEFFTAGRKVFLPGTGHCRKQECGHASQKGKHSRRDMPWMKGIIIMLKKAVFVKGGVLFFR
jgi:hypothetical protein